MCVCDSEVQFWTIPCLSADVIAYKQFDLNSIRDRTSNMTLRCFATEQLNQINWKVKMCLNLRASLLVLTVILLCVKAQSDFNSEKSDCDIKYIFLKLNKHCIPCIKYDGTNQTKSSDLSHIVIHRETDVSVWAAWHSMCILIRN